jgi:arylsulfatase A-like enzyme
MPLPLWKDGELDNKPDIQKHDYLAGGQNGAADTIVGMTDYEKQERIRDYYAEIELIDDNFGRLLEYLDKTGQRENTLIIFMSDHGEMAGDHGLYWKGAYFYEGLTHIPLIMSCPGSIEQNSVCTGLVELVDVAPTILDLLGFEIPYYMNGKSFSKILNGTAPVDFFKNSVYCEFYSVLRGCHEDIYATMYFDGRYKVVVYHGKDYGELYDLSSDPNEFNNLWDDTECFVLKDKLVRRNFDEAILKTHDWSMHRIYGY